MVAGTGAIGSAAASKLINGHSNFSWASVAAAAVGAAAGGSITGELRDANFGEVLADNLIGGTAGFVANRALGGNQQYEQVALDAFGNAIGNSIAANIQQSKRANQTEDNKTIAQKVYEQARAEGKSRQAATMLAVSATEQHSKGAVDLNTEQGMSQLLGGDGSINTDFGIGFDHTKNLQVSNGDDTAQFYTGGIQNDADASAVLDEVSHFLADGSTPLKSATMDFAE